jgi:O-antigen polysaccharide polymerase Wzy
LATIVVPLALAPYDYSALQLCLAMVLIDVCALPMIRHMRLREARLPVLPLICLAYGVQFAIPIFTREPKQAANYDFVYLKDWDVIQVQLLCIGGVILLQLGYHLVRGGGIKPLLPKLNLTMSLKRLEAFCVLAIAGSFLLRSAQAILFNREDLQFVSIAAFLENQVLVAIGLLGWMVYSGNGKKWHKILLYCTVVAVSIGRGFSSTMLELMLVPLIILFTTKWVYSKRIPVFGIILVSALVLFLSPAKVAVRGNMEQGAVSNDAVDVADQWLGQSVDYWAGAFTGERNLTESTLEATARADLVHELTYLYSMSPEVVPYYYGSSYSYFLVALVPRVIWPNKPVVTDETVKFEVEFGLTSEEGALTTAIGPTLIGEGYINFGILGAFLVMFLQGAILGVLEQIFAERGAPGMSVFLALFVYLLNGIGSSAVVMFGNIVQSLVAGCLLLWLFSGRRQSMFIFDPRRPRAPDAPLLPARAMLLSRLRSRQES